MVEHLREEQGLECCEQKEAPGQRGGCGPGGALGPGGAPGMVGISSVTARGARAGARVMSPVPWCELDMGSQYLNLRKSCSPPNYYGVGNTGQSIHCMAGALQKVTQGRVIVGQQMWVSRHSLPGWCWVWQGLCH